MSINVVDGHRLNRSPNTPTPNPIPPNTQEFVDASLNQAGTENFRLTHARDPIVHLPPRPLGFLHEGGQEVFYPGFLAEDGAYVVCNRVGWEQQEVWFGRCFVCGD